MCFEHGDFTNNCDMCATHLDLNLFPICLAQNHEQSLKSSPLVVFDPREPPWRCAMTWQWREMVMDYLGKCHRTQQNLPSNVPKRSTGHVTRNAAATPAAPHTTPPHEGWEDPVTSAGPWVPRAARGRPTQEEPVARGGTHRVVHMAWQITKC